MCTLRMQTRGHAHISLSDIPDTPGFFTAEITGAGNHHLFPKVRVYLVGISQRKRVKALKQIEPGYGLRIVNTDTGKKIDTTRIHHLA